VQLGLPITFGVNYSGVRMMKESGAVSDAEADELEAGAIPSARGARLG
jgi:hypothetical protein